MPEPSQSDPLLQVVLSLLTPLLMAGGITDTDLARRAARQAIAACNGGQGQLVTIAQIVGFAFASLDNLRLSAAPDLSLSMKLKLRGNANALNRSTQRSTAALETHQPNTGHPDPSPRHDLKRARAMPRMPQTVARPSARPWRTTPARHARTSVGQRDDRRRRRVFPQPRYPAPQPTPCRDHPHRRPERHRPTTQGWRKPQRPVKAAPCRATSGPAIHPAKKLMIDRAQHMQTRNHAGPMARFICMSPIS